MNRLSDKDFSKLQRQIRPLLKEVGLAYNKYCKVWTTPLYATTKKFDKIDKMVFCSHDFIYIIDEQSELQRIAMFSVDWFGGDVVSSNPQWMQYFVNRNTFLEHLRDIEYFWK
jgi:hypothetical protein